MPSVLIAAPVHPILMEGLETLGYDIIFTPGILQKEASALLSPCTGVITSTRLQLDKALLDAAPSLRWIGRMGSGMEVVDVPYATEKGITCIASPEGNCNAVAEHAMGLLLSLTKRIGSSAAEVKEGKWLREENRGTEIEGRTVGIIGYGHTGRAFARKLQGFDVSILAYDTAPLPELPRYISPCSQLSRIWNEADIVSFHVPITVNTFHYCDTEFITRMMKPFILLNTSRGGVVDAAAILPAIESGAIIGAGLDVWEEEPLQSASEASKSLLARLLRFPQVIVTPHIAGYSHEALYKMSAVLLKKISALHPL